MANVHDFLSSLGLTPKREGSQWRTQCPSCQDEDHLFVSNSTGLAYCHKCSWKANPYQLCQTVAGIDEPGKIYQHLAEYGLASDISPKQQVNKATMRMMTAAEETRFCQAKGLHAEALRHFTPRMHQSEPWVLLPAYSPGRQTPVGYLRAHIDGKPIQLANGRSERYPLLPGGQHGLFGLRALEDADTVWFCEGWRDALAAIAAGAAATASSGGASTWRDDWLPVFADKIVYVCMDADTAGQRAAERAAKAISRVAAKTYIVTLPFDVAESHGKDLYDYLTDGGDLDELIQSAQVIEPETAFVLLDDLNADTIANAYIEHCGRQYRWHVADGWTVYDGGQYRKCDEVADVMCDLNKFACNCAMSSKGKRIERWAVTDTKLRSVLRQVSFHSSVLLRPDQASPCSLDGTLNPKYIIPLRNGLLDWSCDPPVLHPPTPNYYTINYLPYDWEPGIETPLWTRYLIDVTGGDVEFLDMLQEWAGYCLMKHDQREQKFLLLHGEAATGKSVFVDILVAMLGIENCAAIPLSRFNDPHYLTETYGKMLNVTDESSKTIEAEVETSLKAYTGGTPITFKRMYERPFTAYPTAKIIIATNELPRFRDTSEGVWRRMLLAPFDNVVPEEQRDKRLKAKIKAKELGGVLEWAIEGARRLINQGGFTIPDVSKRTLEQYKRESHPEIYFIEENLVYNSMLGATMSLSTTDVRIAYEQYCKDNGYRPKNDVNFGKMLRKMFPSAERKQVQRAGQRLYVYLGLTWAEDSAYATS